MVDGPGSVGNRARLGNSPQAPKKLAAVARGNRPRSRNVRHSLARERACSGITVACIADMTTSATQLPDAGRVREVGTPPPANAVIPAPLDRGTLNRDRCLQYTERVRSEYLEMPGLSLTLAQAARLWQLDGELATGVLASLTLTGLLRETVTHRFIRA